jgi:hypothetical protein
LNNQVTITKPILAAICTLYIIATQAKADDAYISSGGSPHLMDATRSQISMTREVIKAVASQRENKVTVDCQFVFHNYGPTRTIQMGFPDNSTSDESETPTGSFKTYESYVNGKLVPTNVEYGRDGRDKIVWHTKTVTFPANADVFVHDVYTDIASGAPVEKTISADCFMYLLHTASSWSGPVGDVNVDITLKDIQAPLKLIDAIHTRADLKKLAKHAPKNTVIWSGPSTPTAQGNVIRFHCVNLRPTQNSDICLLFDFQQITD